MKITNIILSIIILLLAIALAVSSFFLYEKREIMLNGWEKLTTTINETASELDKKSGTKLAEDLTQDKLHHTNYANLDDQLKKLNIKQSFSAPGNPLNNAVAESFFATFKKEEAYRRNYTSERSFIDGVANYIEFFNNERQHETLNYHTPAEFERKFGL